jgi:hypothetical protein
MHLTSSIASLRDQSCPGAATLRQVLGRCVFKS